MPISDIVNVVITKRTTGVSRIGFGTPMIMSVEASIDAVFADTAKTYSSIVELGSTGDDYDIDGVTFLKAQALFAQNPKPSQIVIGKRANTPLMTVDITPNAVASILYRASVSGANSAALTGTTDFDFTSDATPTVAEITAGLTAAIDQTDWLATTAYVVGDYVANSGRVYICIVAGTSAGSGGPSGTGSAIVDATVTWAHKGPEQDVNATDGTTKVTVEKADAPGGTGTVGKPFRMIVNDRALLEQQNVTADPSGSISGDFTNIRTASDGNDDFYVVMIDSAGKAEIEALAVTVETTGTPGKLFLASSVDEDVTTSATTDVASVLQSNLYVRTSLLWHEDPFDGPEAAWAGACLPFDPGSITWNLFTLTGVVVSTLTTSEQGLIAGKDANYYIAIAGKNITQNGITAGGDFIDTTRGIDFVAARMTEAIFARLADSLKVPFTDAGVATIEAEVRGVLALSVSQGIFTDDPAPAVQVPRANAVSTADRANRLLPDINWQAQLAGAVHTVDPVSGTVTV